MTIIPFFANSRTRIRTRARTRVCENVEHGIEFEV